MASEPVKGNPVPTAEFARSTPFSRWLRRRLEAVIIPRSEPRYRQAYMAQLDDASRNVEIAVEGLGRLLKRHPLKSLLVLRTLGDWFFRYFGTQKDLAQRDRYLGYTEHDHRIPFVPQQDILYTYMLAQIAYIANELAEISTVRQLMQITEGFMEMNSFGVEAFTRYPSVMPRYTEHDRLSLRVIQYLDKPLNCCPSLHIAYSLFLDGVAEMLIRPLAHKREAFQSVRFSTIGMFNSVLYTKQHSILDVAFGMLCAEVVFERRFDHPFDNFVSTFPALADEHPIPYDEIERMYDEARQIHRQAGSLAETLGIYLERHRYPMMGPQEEIGPGCYFDTGKGALVRPAT